MVGNLQVGCEADFLVLDPGYTPLMQRRTAAVRNLDELLFAMIVLGDDRLRAADGDCGGCLRAYCPQPHALLDEIGRRRGGCQNHDRERFAGMRYVDFDLATRLQPFCPRPATRCSGVLT